MPAGIHTVEFCYRPASVIAGAVISLLTLIGLLWAWSLIPIDPDHFDPAHILILGTLSLGILYWGIWCACIYEGASWLLRLYGLILLFSIGVGFKPLGRRFFKTLPMP